jgi:hypothetical protein
MKNFFVAALLLIVTLVNAQDDFCNSLKITLMHADNNFMDIRGKEVSRKRDYSNREVITYETAHTIKGFTDAKIVKDQEWNWTATFGEQTASDIAAVNFKKLTDLVKGCLSNATVTFVDKTPSSFYESKNMFIFKGAAFPQVNVYQMKDAKSGKFYITLAVKGIKPGY